MRSFRMSHNVCTVNCGVNTYHFRLYRSRNASRFWFVAIDHSTNYSYDSVPTDSVSICLSNLACFVHFLGGKFNCIGYVDAVDMLQNFFSDVIFAEGVIG